MKIIRARVSVLTTVAGLVLLGAGVSTAQASKPPDHQVTLCHRTGSVAGGNTHAGYSIITVDIASVANAKSVRGHDGHNSVGNGPDGDIIPSYTYVSKNGSFTYPGKNLDHGGAAFLANGCKIVTPPPPSSSSSSSSTTTTTSTTSSTTSSTTTSTTPSTTTSTTSATTPGTSTSTTTGTSSSTTPVTGATPVVVAGTVASTTPAPPTTSPDVLAASATAANPLPAGAAAGQANTGKFIGGGLTGLAALLALGAGFVLRRRHAVS